MSSFLRLKEGILMLEIKQMKKLDDYQVQELMEGKLLINKYTLELKYDYELEVYWKEFFFDILGELSKHHSSYLQANPKEPLFDYFKENYYNIINEYKLCIDKRLYVEINDFISIHEWENENNHLLKTKDAFYLIVFR
jgi:hypothetical protein